MSEDQFREMMDALRAIKGRISDLWFLVLGATIGLMFMLAGCATTRFVDEPHERVCLVYLTAIEGAALQMEPFETQSVYDWIEDYPLECVR